MKIINENEELNIRLRFFRLSIVYKGLQAPWYNWSILTAHFKGPKMSMVRVTDREQNSSSKKSISAYL